MSTSREPLFNNKDIVPSKSLYVEVMNELGYTSIVNFYSTVTDNDLIIGVSTGDGENADETISFTVYWTVYLDEF